MTRATAEFRGAERSRESARAVPGAGAMRSPRVTRPAARRYLGRPPRLVSPDDHAARCAASASCGDRAGGNVSKGRLEAFSDGVIAIIITIMVLELKVPAGSDFSALRPMIPVLLSYVLSFVYLAIYWNNHHHLLQVVKHVDGRVLWANAHLLFWLTLFPFATACLGENHLAAWTVAMYGGVMVMAAIAYFILVRALLSLHAKDSVLALAIGRDFKGAISVVIYLFAIGLAFANVWASCALYVLVAIMWLIPDRRIERHVAQ
jgi:uncharacterized membrane protein